VPSPIDSLVSQLDSLMAEGRAIPASELISNRVASGPWAGWRTRSIAFLERNLDPIGSCQASTPQSGSKSAPFRQTPQTMLRALRMQWPSAFIFDLPAARFLA
jgi:hypothetical protein